MVRYQRQKRDPLLMTHRHMGVVPVSDPRHKLGRSTLVVDDARRVRPQPLIGRLVRDACVEVLGIHPTRYGAFATKPEGATHNQDLIRKGNPLAHAIEERNFDHAERWGVRARRNPSQTLCEQGTNGRQLYGL